MNCTRKLGQRMFHHRMDNKFLPQYVEIRCCCCCFCGVLSFLFFALFLFLFCFVIHLLELQIQFHLFLPQLDTITIKHGISFPNFRLLPSGVNIYVCGKIHNCVVTIMLLIDQAKFTDLSSLEPHNHSQQNKKITIHEQQLGKQCGTK